MAGQGSGVAGEERDFLHAGDGVFSLFFQKVRSRLLWGCDGGVIFALVIQRKTWIQFLHD